MIIFNLCMPLVTLLLTVAAALLGYRMVGNPVVFIGVWLLTMASMFSIGLLVASLCRTTRSRCGKRKAENEPPPQ